LNVRQRGSDVCVLCVVYLCVITVESGNNLRANKESLSLSLCLLREKANKDKLQSESERRKRVRENKNTQRWHCMVLVRESVYEWAWEECFHNSNINSHDNNSSISVYQHSGSALSPSVHRTDRSMRHSTPTHQHVDRRHRHRCGRQPKHTHARR
jgi:hypothetical protein